jgi:amphi-Trp domain-containing protein
MPKKDKDIGVKSAITLDQAVAYLQDIVNSLKQKKVCVEHGGDSLVLNPPASVTVEVKARQKSDKESIALKIAWARQVAPGESGPELTISAKGPIPAAATKVTN